MKKNILTTLVIVVMFTTMTFSQTENQDFSDRQHSIGSSLFLLGNFAVKDPPNYFQLNYGYKLTRKDVIIVEAITWTYYKPLGIPYVSSGEYFPGKVRDYGIGIGYQRFHWKNLYTTVQATPFFQQYIDLENEVIQNGFQLWLQLRLGYRFEFFEKRFFLEPSVVCNYWPVNTNMPESFLEQENKWPNYFLFEPGLHFGIKF